LKALSVAVLALAALWFGASHIDRQPLPGAATPPARTAKIHRHLKRAQMAPAALPPGTVWRLRDGKSERTYAIALDELYVPVGERAQHIHRLPAQPNLAALLSTARGLASQTGTRPQLVLYPLNGPRDEDSRRIVTMKVHIRTDDLAAVQTAAASLGLTAWKTPSYAPRHAIAEVASSDPSEPLRIAALLSKLPLVSSAIPLLAGQRSKRTLSTPADTLFPQQWHLKNTGQQKGAAGIDINVTPVWPTLDGTGLSIGIVDDGLQISHPDLSANVAPTGHYDWNGNDTDPSPNLTEDFHGTACAGLAGARDNGIGVVGAAPRATLYGLRLIALPETDQDDAEAMSWKSDVIQIKSNSWGPADDTPWVLGEAGSLWMSAVATNTTTGRGGLGTIYVWAAGNGKASGDQGGKDAYASNMHVIPVGAVTNKAASATFGEGGAHLVVCAPGDSSIGIVTTDLTGSRGYNKGTTTGELSDSNYTQTFAGTSAATPIVAGVVALMLEANPLLGWRDVKEILLRSSTQIQPADTDWVARDGGQPGLPLIKQHTYFGGGLINAQAATALAGTWTPLGTETVLTASSSAAQTIPDAGAALAIPFDLDSGPAVRVEHVELMVDITHPYRGDLEIKLTSPSGIVSTLARATKFDDGTDYPDWTFTSVRHWGESSAGTWTLSIRDAANGDVGQFVSATLKVHGVAVTPPAVTLQPSGAVAAQGSAFTLTTAGTGSSLSYQWKKDGSFVSGATGATLSLPTITLAQAGTYTCVLTNHGGSVTTDPAKVVVYNPNAQSQAANPGTTFTALLIAAGPIDSFQWSLNNSPLTNSSHVTGATTASLSVLNVTSADNGSYTVVAMFNGDPLPTGAITFAVRTPPAVSAPSSFESRIGATVTVPLTTDSGSYTYRYTGLPKGLAYSTTTGAISGRTTATGTFPLVLTATDAFGLVTTLHINLVVAPLPAALVGVFNGTVDRDATLNQSLGGSLTFTTTAAGLLTGRLTQGARAYPFTGALDGAPGANATATITIPRKGLSSISLHLDIPPDDSGAGGTINSTIGIAAWRKSAATPSYAGRYTFALETPAGAGWPAGYSTGTLAVSPAGAVTWTLHPADGTAALKGATTLSADGILPLFAPVKTPAGSFLGFFSLPVNSSPASSISGSVTWLRAATSSAKLANSAGFGPLSMTLYGGLYTSPSPGSPLLGLPNETDNADLRFGGTDVDLGGQAAFLSSVTITITGQNKVVIPKSPTALKLTVNAATGAFSGTFTLTDPGLTKPGSTVKRSVKFSGVFLLQDDLGAGSFVLPAIPGSANGTRSGSVIFIQSH
jgi:subtilisin-like proprotein convertase family protein